MPALNNVQIMGNLTRDPELRYLPDGTPICGFSVAINRVWAVNGERHEDTTFVDCEAWRKQAEVIAEFCRKSHAIFVEGWLQQDSWNDKTTGEKKTRMKVRVRDFQFLEPKRTEGEREEKNGDGSYKF